MRRLRFHALEAFFMLKLLIITFFRFFVHGYGLKFFLLFLGLFFLRYLFKVWKRVVNQ